MKRTEVMQLRRGAKVWSFNPARPEAGTMEWRVYRINSQASDPCQFSLWLERVKNGERLLRGVTSRFDLLWVCRTKKQAERRSCPPEPGDCNEHSAYFDSLRELVLERALHPEHEAHVPKLLIDD